MPSAAVATSATTSCPSSRNWVHSSMRVNPSSSTRSSRLTATTAWHKARRTPSAHHGRLPAGRDRNRQTMALAPLPCADPPPEPARGSVLPHDSPDPDLEFPKPRGRTSRSRCRPWTTGRLRISGSSTQQRGRPLRGSPVPTYWWDYSPAMFADLSRPFSRSSRAAATSPLSMALPAFLVARVMALSMSVSIASTATATRAASPSSR
jgi:hypothetical protein